MCTTAIVSHLRNTAVDADDAELQNSLQKSPVCHQRTQQTFDACGPYQHSGQSDRGTSAVQQKLCSASKNFNNIFQTPDLELTDADLEFNLK